MSDSRDWQADMERVEDFKFAQTLVNGIQPRFHGEHQMPEPAIYALEYWLKQYAAEKARADQIKEFWEEVAAEQAQSYLDSFAREEKLKEVMEWAIEQSRWGDPGNALDKIVKKMQDTISTVYPKEGTE